MLRYSKTKLIFFCLLFISAVVLIAPQVALAQGAGDFGANDLNAVNLGTRELKDTIALIINIFLGFLGAIAVGLIIYAGYLWLTAGGEEDKIADAKKIIRNAVIGLAVILSAYAITAFVIGRLNDATRNTPGGQGDNGGGDGGLGGGGQGLFRVTNIQPRGQLRIRNIVVQASFSNAINAALIDENNVLTNQEGVKVERANGQGGFERVAGTLTIDPNNRQRVLFTPQANCPEPNQQLFCFGYDENNADLNLYRVTVLSEAGVSLRSVGGLAVSCNGASCVGEFRVGNLVDTENPVVDFTEAINRAGQHFDLIGRAIFSLNEIYNLFAQATDDGGLTSVDFFVANNLLTTNEAGEDTPLEFLAQAEWATNNLQPQTYELTVRAYDAAGHQSELGAASVLIRPDHCFNNQQDANFEETGVDCGGACGACEGDPCGEVIENRCTNPDNQICASNVCNVDSCLCQQPPRIMAVNPDNGAIGNWVTIAGRGFGNAPGQILLGNVQGRLPRFCQASWTDTQIILELPAGLDLGNTQLSVVTSQNLTSNRVDFSVNDTERPGICQLIPGEIRPGGSFALIGYQFGDVNNPDQQKNLYFGRFDQNLIASEPVWRAAAGRALVSAHLPNLNPGQTSVKVRIDGQDSNALALTVLSEENYPTISDFSPKQGNAGQYVDIYGSDFGQYQPGQSKVIFNNNVEGSFDFPAECRADNSFWQDNHIIVKAPEGLTDGAIIVQRSDGRQGTTDQPFDYQAEAELTPGICSLYPAEGQVGSTFEVAGEYFNNGTLKLGEQNLNVRPDNENRHFNRVAVPEGARSGPVKVVRGELQSNSVDFSVTGGPGREPGAPVDYYQWQFTTCENCVVPEVVESQSCQLGLASPTPRKNSLNNFTDTRISAAFNTDMNDELFGLGSTVIISSCGNSEALGRCSAVQGLAGEFEFGQAGAGEYFVLNLDSALQTSTWYQITLRNLRSQQENLALAEPYVWQFKTRANNEVCQITNVSVNPNQRLISNNNPVYLNDEVLYRSYPYNAENCNICPNTFSWSWDSSNQNQAEIDRVSAAGQSLMKAKAITQSPAGITATAQDQQGHSGDGTAQVEIVPRDFGILYSRSCSLQPQSPSPYASIQNACLNAKIAVQFNSIMTDGLLAADALTLKQRGDNQTIPVTLDRGLYYEAAGRSGLRGVIFNPNQNLQPDTWYEVTLNNNLANAEGGQFIGSRSWQFKTRSGNELCQFDQVVVNPGSAILPVDQSHDYTAETIDSASCQLIKEPQNLRWSWRSGNETVAEVGQSAVSHNSVLAKQLGETKIRAQALGVENTGQNGRLTVSLGEEINLAITQHQPVGADVCQNALGQVRFNLGLNPDSINQQNFIVVEHGNTCPEAGCAVAAGISANQNKTIVSILPREKDNRWKKQTRYEIKIRGGAAGVKTADGQELTQSGCAQGMSWEPAAAACAWSFTVGERQCEVGAIEVVPASATINKGAFQEWSAYAASATGELLADPIENWRTSNREIATVDFNRNGDTSLAQSRGNGQGETTIAAMIGTTVGLAKIKVNDIANGPSITGVQPQNGAERVCRNASVTMEFDKLLNKDTVNQNNFKLEYQIEAASQPVGCRQATAAAQKSGNLLSANNLIGQWLNNSAGKIFSSLWNSLFNKARAGVFWCPVQGQWLEEHANEQSRVQFGLTQALPPVSTIRATVLGGANGVKALNGLPLAGDLNNEGNYSYSFSTGADVCDLDFVTVAASAEENKKDWTFTTSFDNEADNVADNENFDTIYDADKKYTANGFSQTGEELASIAGVYEWGWQWQTANQSVAALSENRDNFMVVKAQNKNGQSDIIAGAVFPANYQKPALSASAKAIVDICENRWNPSGGRNPDYKFIDPNYNFSLSYCRDAGGEGTMDDLPALFEPQSQDIAPDNDPAKDDLLREYLIPVPTTGDVLGLRIYKNNLHLNPRAWYQKNINADVQGNPANAEVDGYQAIQDGRTVYVAAANARTGQIAYGNGRGFGLARAGALLNQFWLGIKQQFSNLFVAKTLAQFDAANALNNDAPDINPNDALVINVGYRNQSIYSAYTNVYLLSYNQNASPKTMEIVKRLMERWRFNSNIDNPDLNVKLRRDVKRLVDLTAVSQSVAAYQAGHGQAVPALTAGSFLSGRSNSKWPSWNQTLAPALSTSLPVDPINKFNRCIVCEEPELVNAGFEDPNDLGGGAEAGNPGGLNDGSGWRLTYEHGGLAVSHNVNKSFVKEGNASAGILARNAQGGVVQSISLLPNTTYELSAWVYVVSGRAHLTFDGNDYGNEWLTPPDVTGWVQLKNRLVTNPAVGGGANGSNNFIFIRSHEGAATFYIDKVSIQTQGGNCGYDRETCWNPNANQSRGAFACDADSYFYSYETIGNNNYLLAAKMEANDTWISDRDNPLNPHLSLSKERVLGCTTEAVGGFCGDGVVNGNEQCEPGMSNNYCPAGARWYTPRYLGCEAVGSEFGECTWVNPANYGDDWANLNQGQRCGGYCGDRVLNTAAGNYQISPDEQCDISAEPGVDGFSNGVINGSNRDNQYACGASCRDIGGWCGDNIIQPVYGEQCDGNANGWSCPDGRAPRCTACGVVCDSGEPFQGVCGDGVKQPQEACDASVGLPINTACSDDCQALSCRNNDYLACDGSVANGCEVNRLTAVQNCGRCGNVCSAADTNPSCVAGECRFSCIAGSGACEDNDPDNGCETDLYSDVNHCGACGQRCTPPAFATATCNEQGCGFTCNLGYERQGNQCVADCGDGIILGNEVCDDGDRDHGNHNGQQGYCNNTCSGFSGLGRVIFSDGFNDGNYTHDDGHQWSVREHGPDQYQSEWSVVQLEGDRDNPFTLQGAQAQGNGRCGNPQRYYLKSFLPNFDFNGDTATVVTRIQIKDGNPTALILGGYEKNNNQSLDSAYALWTNWAGQGGNDRLRLVKINKMNEPSSANGVFDLSLDRDHNNNFIDPDQWRWLAMKITYSGEAATFKFTDWAYGERMLAEDDWQSATDNYALPGRQFGVAVWGDCATSWYDDFQVYVP